MKTKDWQHRYDYNVPHSVSYPRFPVQAILHLAAVKFPNKTAVNMYNTKFTCAEIWWRSLRLANALTRLGVKQGDCVALAMPNSPQYVISYYAVMCLGSVVVNINPLYPKAQFRNALREADVTALITIDSTLPVVRNLAQELNLKGIVVTRLTDFMKEFETSSPKSLGLEEGWHHFSRLMESHHDIKLPRINIRRTDPALIQYTRGTAGSPKPVVLTHQNIVTAVVQFSLWSRHLIDSMPVEHRTLMAALPYTQIYGNIAGMNWSLFNGITQILFPHFDANEFIETAVKLEDATILPARPSMIAKVIHQPEEYGLCRGRPIQWIHSVGAPMPSELTDCLRDKGLFYTEGWGMTETTAMGFCNPVLGSKPGSIGLPVMDNEIRLLDLDGGRMVAKPGDTGEIIIKGPSVMRADLNRSEDLKGRIKDGWLFTGDVARTDEEGYFYIADRKEDVISTGGLNVYPREIEAVLSGHPMIAEAVAVGVQCDDQDEKVKAFVVLNPGDRVSDAEIINHCKSELSPHKIPREVEFRDGLPKSADGEILRMVIRNEENAKHKLMNGTNRY